MTTTQKFPPLQDFRHEHEAALDVGGRLFLHDAHLVGRDDGGVDEPQEEDGAHGANVVLDRLREPFTKNLDKGERIYCFFLCRKLIPNYTYTYFIPILSFFSN